MSPSRALIGALACAAAISAASSAGASAATEFGNVCTANATTPGFVLIQTAKPLGVAPSLAAPVSGVVTKWKIAVIPVGTPFPEQLKVLRPASTPKTFTIVGESAVAPVSTGENSFDTRIPVEAGDLLGLLGTGEFGSLYCKEQPSGNRLAILVGNPNPGSSGTTVEEADKFALPVSATIEPDADHDGFGDETQDKCPQSAAVQSTCPLLAIEAVAIAARNAVSVLTATNLEAQVSATGSVQLSKLKTATLTAAAQTIAPGALRTFELKLTKQVTKALARLPRKRSLKLNVVLEGRNVAGVASSRSLTVTLRGRARR